MTNVITIVGNLTQDVVAKKMNEGKVYTKNTIACARNYKLEGGEHPVDFFDIVIFGSQAEFLNTYGYKGCRVCVVGKMYTNRYQDKNGNWRSSYEINVDSVDILSKREMIIKEPDEVEEEDTTYAGEYKLEDIM